MITTSIGKGEGKMQICEIWRSEKNKTIQICENGKKLDYGR